MPDKNLEQFAEQLKKDIDNFVEYYKRGMDSEDYFPATMPDPDWYEQFEAYEEFFELKKDTSG